MHTVTWIEGNKLFSQSSPSFPAAIRLFWNLRCKLGRKARLWKSTKAGQPELIL